MRPLEGQKFKTKRGYFKITGTWWKAGEVKSLEFVNLETGELHELSLSDFNKAKERTKWIA